MLRAAAERGVKVKIIVYKEVEAVLTREFLSLIDISSTHVIANMTVCS